MTLRFITAILCLISALNLSPAYAIGGEQITKITTSNTTGRLISSTTTEEIKDNQDLCKLLPSEEYGHGGKRDFEVTTASGATHVVQLSNRPMGGKGCTTPVNIVLAAKAYDWRIDGWQMAYVFCSAVVFEQGQLHCYGDRARTTILNPLDNVFYNEDGPRGFSEPGLTLSLRDKCRGRVHRGDPDYQICKDIKGDRL